MKGMSLLRQVRQERDIIAIMCFSLRFPNVNLFAMSGLLILLSALRIMRPLQPPRHPSRCIQRLGRMIRLILRSIKFRPP